MQKTHFRFELGIELHAVGDVTCRGCSKPPVLCSKPDCNGLVHHQENADGDESGSWFWTDTCCDVCGETEEHFQLTDEEARSIWDKRDLAVARRKEEYRRKQQPTTREKFEDLVDYCRRSRRQGFFGAPNVGGIPLADRGFFYLGSLRPDLSWGDYQSLFTDVDSNDLFHIFITELKANPNDIAIRGAAVSLYWHLSRLYRAWREGIYNACGEPTGGSYWDYDVSDEWLANQRQYRGNLAQIVHMLNVNDCTDWARTKWEIINACAASDWHLARKLLEHAAKSRFISETQVIALRANLEHRILFGADIDEKLGLGMNRSVHPEWRSFKDQFWGCPECSLEALEIGIDGPPFRHPYSDLDYDDVAAIFFIWCVLDQEVPYPSETQSAHINRVINEIESQLPAMGDESSMYVSFVGQFHKASCRFDKAAEAYRRLMDMPNLFGWKPIPFALEASKLFQKCGRLDDAELTLRKILQTSPDSGKCWEQLEAVLLAGGKIQDAAEAAKKAKALVHPERLKPTTILLSNFEAGMPSGEEIEKELEQWKRFGLSSGTLKELAQAIGHEKSAQRDAQKVMRYRETAAFYFAKSVECQLLEAVFLRWREGMTADELQKLSSEVSHYDKKLGRFFERRTNGTLTLGEMANIVRNARGKVGAFASMSTFLRSQHPALLDSGSLEILERLTKVRNAEGHPQLRSQSGPQTISDIGEAGRLAERVFQALTSASAEIR